MNAKPCSIYSNHRTLNDKYSCLWPPQLQIVMCLVNNNHSGRPTQHNVNTHILVISAELGLTMKGGTQALWLPCAVPYLIIKKAFPKWHAITVFLFLHTGCAKGFYCTCCTGFISRSSQ